LSATFEQALGHLQSGRLREAEAIYREILKADPENVDALHLLGVAVFQAGRGDEAAGFIERSLHQNPGNADALNNLGQVYEFLNRTDDAIDAYRKAVTTVDIRGHTIPANPTIERIGHAETLFINFREE